MKIMMRGGSEFLGAYPTRRPSRDGHRVSGVTRHPAGANRLAIVPRLRARRSDPCDEA